MKKAGLRKPQGRYHHGNLRQALVSTALRVVAEEGVEALSLRELARRLGVSHAAPAHHFPDRTALLVALAGDGFVHLGAALRAAEAPAAGVRLAAAGRAFLGFALDHPGYFRAMFGPHVATLPRAPEAVARAAEAGYGVIVRGVEGLVGAGDARVALLSFAAWSFLHGAVTLFLDGLIRLQVPELSSRAALELWVDRALASLCEEPVPRRGGARRRSGPHGARSARRAPAKSPLRRVGIPAGSTRRGEAHHVRADERPRRQI